MIRKRPLCQVGGGLKDAAVIGDACSTSWREVRVIYGSKASRPCCRWRGAAVQDHCFLEFAESLKASLGEAALCFSVDTKGGRVAVRGWKESIELTPEEAVTWLEDSCAAFLYTHVDTEGTDVRLSDRTWRAVFCARARRSSLIVAGWHLSARRLTSWTRWAWTPSPAWRSTPARWRPEPQCG